MPATTGGSTGVSGQVVSGSVTTAVGPVAAGDGPGVAAGAGFVDGEAAGGGAGGVWTGGAVTGGVAMGEVAGEVVGGGVTAGGVVTGGCVAGGVVGIGAGVVVGGFVAGEVVGGFVAGGVIGGVVTGGFVTAGAVEGVGLGVTFAVPGVLGRVGAAIFAAASEAAKDGIVKYVEELLTAAGV